MPIKPRSPCVVAGCPSLAVDAGRCEVHLQQRRREMRERYLDRRPSASARGYGSDWQMIRAAFLARHRVCVDCRDRGVTTPATEAHHIISRRAGGSDHEDNLLALCHDCHSKRTAVQEPGGWGRMDRSKGGR